MWQRSNIKEGGQGGGRESGQRLAGSRADNSRELFEKMRWEKGKRQSDMGIRENGENIGKEKEALSTVND